MKTCAAATWPLDVFGMFTGRCGNILQAGALPNTGSPITTLGDDG